MRERPAPIADTFPRAPKDAEEREAVEHADPSFSCRRQSPAAPFYACTRAKRHDGDHVAAGTADIKARWPQPAPAKGERWGLKWRSDGAAWWSRRNDTGDIGQDITPVVFDTKAAAERRRDAVYYERNCRLVVCPYESEGPAPAPLPAAASEERTVIGWRISFGDGYASGEGSPTSVPRERAFLFRDRASSTVPSGKAWARRHARFLRKRYGAESTIVRVTRVVTRRVRAK